MKLDGKRFYRCVCDSWFLNTTWLTVIKGVYARKRWLGQGVYVYVPTLLSGPVENLNVFQLYTNACPELHSICSIVFASSLNGAIGMGPKQNNKKLWVNKHHEMKGNHLRAF